uniref:Uncharacterized protein n=1 Tax=Anopheles farauti TaxID=69004 RepID=A0A182QQ64_9DIPT
MSIHLVPRRNELSTKPPGSAAKEANPSDAGWHDANRARLVKNVPSRASRNAERPTPTDDSGALIRGLEHFVRTDIRHIPENPPKENQTVAAVEAEMRKESWRKTPFAAGVVLFYAFFTTGSASFWSGGRCT